MELVEPQQGQKEGPAEVGVPLDTGFSFVYTAGEVRASWHHRPPAGCSRYHLQPLRSPCPVLLQSAALKQHVETLRLETAAGAEAHYPHPYQYELEHFEVRLQPGPRSTTLSSGARGSRPAQRTARDAKCFGSSPLFPPSPWSLCRLSRFLKSSWSQGKSSCTGRLSRSHARGSIRPSNWM